MDKVDLTLKLAHGERKGSAYQVVPGIQPPENPLLRKFNMANRDRDSAGLRIDIAATDSVNVGLGAESTKDDYSDSAIGLTSGRDLNLNADVTWVVTEQTSLHFFANHQEIKSTQRGSQTYSVADWAGENKDTIDTFGIGVKHAAIKDKLDIGADYTYSRSRSDISVNTGASNSAFPQLIHEARQPEAVRKLPSEGQPVAAGQLLVRALRHQELDARRRHAQHDSERPDLRLNRRRGTA